MNCHRMQANTAWIGLAQRNKNKNQCDGIFSLYEYQL